MFTIPFGPPVTSQLWCPNPSSEIAAAVLEHGHEQLAEEERDDREVVADQTSRRQRDEEAEDRRRGDRDRHDDQRVPVQAELRRREHRVHVRAEAEERDVAEVEQSRVADDDVQAEAEQHVEHRVEADADDVAVGGERGQQRRRDPERGIERRPRRSPDLALEPAEHARQLLVPLLVRRDPVVDADADAGLALVGRAGTFGISRPPSIRPFAPPPAREVRSAARA